MRLDWMTRDCDVTTQSTPVISRSFMLTPCLKLVVFICEFNYGKPMTDKFRTEDMKKPYHLDFVNLDNTNESLKKDFWTFEEAEDVVISMLRLYSIK